MSEPQQSLLEEKLEWAERCLRAAVGHLELQEARVADLEHRGEDSSQARALLNILRETYRIHLTERDALIKQIEAE